MDATREAVRSELVVLHHTPGACAFGHVGNIALQAWFRAPTGEDGEALVHFSNQLVAAFPMGLSSLHWARPGGGLPDQAAREHFQTSLAEHADAFGEVAIVLEGGGFWVGAVRSMLVGLRLAARNRYGVNVFATIDEAAAALPDSHLTRTGITATANSIRDGMRALVALG